MQPDEQPDPTPVTIEPARHQVSTLTAHRGEQAGERRAIKVSDQQIQGMRLDERQALAYRLLGSTHLVTLPARAARRRHRILITLTAACIGLVPWILFLATSLPRHYQAANWRDAWVGFDVLLLASLAVTAYFGWRRHHLVLLASLATGVLLICDAWFDLTTASARDWWAAGISAAFIELPLAALLLWMSYRLLSLTVTRHLGGANTPTVWRSPSRFPIKETALPQEH